MRRKAPVRWILPAILAAGLSLVGGCAVARPTLFDAEALQSSRTLIVLPMVDAPGPSGQGAGRVVSGFLVGEFLKMDKYDIINVPASRLQEICDELGYAAEDCYDPAVAAAVGAKLKADARKAQSELNGKVDDLSKAGQVSWSAMSQALDESRNAFAKAIDITAKKFNEATKG